MKRNVILITSVVLALLSANLHAEWFKTTIKAIQTEGNGNIAFRTNDASPGSPCVRKDTWEIRPGDTNFQVNTSILLTAYASKSEIYINDAVLSCAAWDAGIINQIMLGDWFN